MDEMSKFKVTGDDLKRKIFDELTQETKNKV